MQIIGHRGAGGKCIENTLSAMEYALKLGCQQVELDVHVCKSGELVVFHDFNLRRMAGLNHEISSLDKQEIKSISLEGGEKIPFLDEVFLQFSDRLPLNIELKGRATSTPLYELLQEFKQRGKWKKLPLLSSLSYHELEDFSTQSREYPLGWVIEKWHDSLLTEAEKIGIQSIHPSKEITNEKLVRECHQKNMRVLVFTVNEKEDFLRLKDLGVDGIFTDYPERFI